MMEVCKKSKCIGCLNCKKVCKFNAIDIEKDKLGFIYPVINKNCKNCESCKKKCPIMINNKNETLLNICYAAKNKNDNIRKKSSSGGIFFLLAEEELKNGIVYGASYTKNVLRHVRITKMDELEKILGSKYIQSDLDDVFEEIEEELKNGTNVLFCSTPCQVAALKIFLQEDYDNLFTIDFICHGVGSLKVLNYHLNDILKSTKSKEIKSINFRDKSTGWNKFSMSINTEKEKYSKVHSEDNFMKTFLYNLCLRESCYQCKFKQNNRWSDITLADFWGIDNVIENFDDDIGTSAIIINTKKGKDKFDLIKNHMLLSEVEYEEINKNNISLSNTSLYNKCRDEFINNVIENKTLQKLDNNYFRRENGEKYNK